MQIDNIWSMCIYIYIYILLVVLLLLLLFSFFSPSLPSEVTSLFNPSANPNLRLKPYDFKEI